MSVIFVSKQSAIVDHEAWMLQMIGQHSSSDNGDHSHCDGGIEERKKIKFQELFDLRTPFLMDDQACKKAVELEAKEANATEGTAFARERKRKRKKKEPRIQGNESEAEVGHIQEVFSALRLTPEFKAHFSYIPTPQDFRLNNSHIRDLRKRFTEATNTVLPLLDECSGQGGRLQYKVIDGKEYVLPPDVRYICGDAADILKHTAGTLYDLVVLDPPWHNKYIKRRKMGHGSHHGYDMMTVEDILRLPIGSVLRDGALVVVWCTNNSSQIREFLTGLHLWGVQLVAKWYWLKVTRGGEPVTPLTDSCLNKRPYEHLFLAQKYKSNGSSSSIPDGLVFSSVPSGLHSHKPPLEEILKPYMCPRPQCLEVFARSLVPGWTSFGLEVLRLQHSSLFQTIA